MKILNYSTWSLLFTTIMQVVSGYTCPTIGEINKKIDAKEPMLFPLVEGDRSFWRYKAFNNRVSKFHLGTGKAAEIVAIYYQEPVENVNSTLTCIYKNNQSMYFSLGAIKKRVNEVNSASITNDINWSGFYLNGLYVCGNDNRPKESIENCQFSLKVSR